MDVEHFRGGLSDSAGQYVTLPEGAVEEGFALWCTGPDIGREVFRDENGEAVTDVSCEIEEIAPLGALPCSSSERIIWIGNNATETVGNAHADSGYNSAGGSRSGSTTGSVNGSIGDSALPPLPAGLGQNYLSTATISQLAKSAGTSTAGLAKALASAQGSVIKILAPSPWGTMSFVWEDSKGLSNITTVKSSGSIITKRSTKPITLPAKSKQ